MESLASWSRFIVRQAKSPPLVLVHGVRHAVLHEVHCPMHSHPAIEIVYHAVGRGISRLADGPPVSFSEGGAVIYAPHERHDQVMDCEGEDLCVQLALPSGLRGVPKTCLVIPLLKDPALIEDIRLLSRGHVHATPLEQAIFNLRATCTLMALVQLACTRPDAGARTASENHVRKAEQFIRDRFSTIPSMQEVAGHVGISHDHLRHAFRAHRRKSMVRYLNEVRIDRAKTLLIHTRLPLKQVAAMCGFHDVYYFSAVFRNFARTSPGHFRSQNI